MPAAPSLAPAPAPGADDPHAIGAAAGRLGRAPQKDGRTAFTILGAVLEPGEAVETLVVGKCDGQSTVLALTSHSLVLVDDRQWKPRVERFALDQSLQVQGWQDERTASLTLLHAGRQVVVERIVDRPFAVDMAQRIRARTGA